MTIRYTTFATPFGQFLLAASGMGVCAAAFVEHESEADRILREVLPDADLARSGEHLQDWSNRAAAWLNGEIRATAIPLEVDGTAFQRRVWSALVEIPYGKTRSYSEIAASIGGAEKVRAVAAACAANRVAVLIPCHRAVGAGGALTGYRWGIDRKRRLLEMEARVSRGVYSYRQGSFPFERAPSNRRNGG